MSESQCAIKIDITTKSVVSIVYVRDCSRKDSVSKNKLDVKSKENHSLYLASIAGDHILLAVANSLQLTQHGGNRV